MAETWRERIVCDPAIRHGEPCIRGTRIAVAAVVGSLADLSMDELLAEFPQIDCEDVRAALFFAAEASKSVAAEQPVLSSAGVSEGGGGSMKHIHGTIRVPGKHHPVLDIDKWIQQFPFDPARIRFNGRPSTPGGVAFFEQARKLAGEHGDLGPSAPVDMFTWSDRSWDPEWLTKIGGCPWREKHKPWPKAPDGTYLTFLGQLCFADSKDLFPFELPGDVALIFGKYFPIGCTTCEGYALEWSNIELEKPLDYFGEFGTELPICYRGVIHRTVQYTDHKQYVPRFEEIGGSWGELSGEVQATSIGTRAMLPQGWPFMEGDGNALVGVLSEIRIGWDWPLCDMPGPPESVDEDGKLSGSRNADAMDFTIGDCGSVYIYRDKRGRFRLEEATH